MPAPVAVYARGLEIWRCERRLARRRTDRVLIYGRSREFREIDGLLLFHNSSIEGIWPGPIYRYWLSIRASVPQQGAEKVFRSRLSRALPPSRCLPGIRQNAEVEISARDMRRAACRQTFAVKSALATRRIRELSESVTISLVVRCLGRLV